MTLHRRTFLYGISALPAINLLGGRPLPGLVATVYNGQELHTALQAAGPGSAIELAPGNYGDIGRFVLKASDVSVSVRAPLRTVVRSPFVVDGSYVRMEGLAFEQGVHLVGDGLRVAGSRFNDRGVELYGPNAEVVGCEFVGVNGHAVSIRGSATNAHVHRNTIRDKRGAEAIQVGLSMVDSNRNVSALIENNQLDNISGDSEAISVKSSGNTIRDNTLSDSAASIVNRHGQNNTYQGNTFRNAYWLVIHDKGNRVIGNRFENSRQQRDIRIMCGNTSWESTSQGRHPAANDTFVDNNNGILIIGDAFDGMRVPATDTTVGSHNGQIILGREEGTRGVGSRGENDDDDDRRRGGRRA